MRETDAIAFLDGSAADAQAADEHRRQEVDGDVQQRNAAEDQQHRHAGKRNADPGARSGAEHRPATLQPAVAVTERHQAALGPEVADDQLAVVLQARHRRLKRIVLDTHRAPRAAPRHHRRRRDALSRGAPAGAYYNAPARFLAR
ncbi:MAG: hypothetical protein AW07_01314 [Candidatus Accumulibacter sp. SK-11]|nr:MAG: hypothetical protein AW07_01314 [Candidatus Accumulibacter sp. SK-11]